MDRVRWKEVKKYSNDLNTNKEMFGKKKTSDSAGEWTKTGSFLHKPSRGWLHSDNSLQEGGVCYAVKVSESTSWPSYFNYVLSVPFINNLKHLILIPPNVNYCRSIVAKFTTEL